MKIEIIIEKKFSKEDWYELIVDDEYVIGSHNLEKLVELVNIIKKDPTMYNKSSKKVLFFEEIDVSLNNK
jgi:hypothetical protein